MEVQWERTQLYSIWVSFFTPNRNSDVHSHSLTLSRSLILSHFLPLSQSQMFSVSFFHSHPLSRTVSVSVTLSLSIRVEMSHRYIIILPSQQMDVLSRVRFKLHSGQNLGPGLSVMVVRGDICHQTRGILHPVLWVNFDLATELFKAKNSCGYFHR